MVKCCVIFEVRTEFFNIILTGFGFKGLTMPYQRHNVYRAEWDKGINVSNKLNGRERNVIVSNFNEMLLSSKENDGRIVLRFEVYTTWNVMTVSIL
jgi:hypothetical protein